jgi:hypothetical protein
LLDERSGQEGAREQKTAGAWLRNAGREREQVLGIVERVEIESRTPQHQ